MDIPFVLAQLAEAHQTRKDLPVEVRLSFVSSYTDEYGHHPATYCLAGKPETSFSGFEREYLPELFGTDDLQDAFFGVLQRMNAARARDPKGL